MKQGIESALRPLRGLPLWAVGRAASLVWFCFGQRRIVRNIRGETREVGEFALHLECPWRLIGETGETLATDQSEVEILTQLASPALMCSEVIEGQHGELRLRFAGGQELSVEPDEVDCFEYWRFFRPYSEQPHFVVGSSGINPEG